MKEIKEELIHKTYVTKYEANDGTIFTTAEECQKYENSARAVLLARFKDLQIKLISEYELFSTGSEEYFYSIVKLTDPGDIDLVLQLWCLVNRYYSEDEPRMQEVKEKCHKALVTNDYLIIGRGCEYDNYDGFWIHSTLTDLLNGILKNCDPESKIKIEDEDDIAE